MVGVVVQHLAHKVKNMTKKYIAIGSVGETLPGEEVKGLDENRIQALLASGAIEEEKAPAEPKVDGSAARLAELEKANTDLVAANKLMTDEKVKSDQENGELKAKVVELEKALAASEAALKKATADAKKAATEAK